MEDKEQEEFNNSAALVLILGVVFLIWLIVTWHFNFQNQLEAKKEMYRLDELGCDCEIGIYNGHFGLKNYYVNCQCEGGYSYFIEIE